MDHEPPVTSYQSPVTDHERWMQQALALAHQAEQQGEVPVGAVLVREGQVLGKGWNQPIIKNDPTAHAEVVALRAAAEQLGNYRLNNSTLYVTLEPCAMCAGAIVHARVDRLVYGAVDPRAGAAGSQFNILQNPSLNHQVEILPGVLALECGQLLKGFFQEKRG